MENEHLERSLPGRAAGIDDDGLRLVVEQAKSEAKITRQISLSEVSDLSALRAAQSELGIRAR